MFGGTFEGQESRWMKQRLWLARLRREFLTLTWVRSIGNLIDRDHGNFELKTRVFLWFNDDVIPRERKRVQEQALDHRPVDIRGCNVRATLSATREIAGPGARCV